ncbi:MAG TPA: transposase [Streptosporangiaceae bacterium]|nr:transposase [Streptosporangiaceae bacterium]
MIGIDPHKGSHTAVAISAAEEPLGDLRVRAGAAQAGTLAGWAAAWPERTWAVEGAGGLGHLLGWQLVAAGERVLDVPPKLAARVRLLGAGDTNKNDPDDALPVAVAALRSKARREVAAEDHAAVLKVWSKRHRDLARARNQVACRLHAVLRPARRRRQQRDHRSSRCPHPGEGHAVRAGRGGAPPPSSWRTCEAWMPSSARPGRSWPRPSVPRAPASPGSSVSARSAPAP